MLRTLLLVCGITVIVYILEEILKLLAKPRIDQISNIDYEDESDFKKSLRIARFYATIIPFLAIMINLIIFELMVRFSNIKLVVPPLAVIFTFLAIGISYPVLCRSYAKISRSIKYYSFLRVITLFTWNFSIINNFIV
jgi:hypothetical protein